MCTNNIYNKSLLSDYQSIKYWFFLIIFVFLKLEKTLFLYATFL